jgi:Xaa-Pro aminopeptidase
MNQEALGRVDDTLQRRGLDAALFSSPWTITWLTGYAPPIQTGPAHLTAARLAGTRPAIGPHRFGW